MRGVGSTAAETGWQAVGKGGAQPLAPWPLATPALLLDRERLEGNLLRMRQQMASLGVALRPHLKTAKCAEICRLAIAGQPGGIAVQTLAEAAYFAEHGFKDILYCVGIVPFKVAALAELQARGTAITLVADSVEMVRAVQAAAVSFGTRFKVLIEIDSDGCRCGIPPDDPSLLDVAAALSSGPGVQLSGVMTHAGAAYQCRSAADLRAMAETERRAVVDAASRLRGAGYECPVVSMGSTPTAYFAERLDGVTEVRAGVYMFNDLTMVDLGVCSQKEIAISVLASVVGHSRRSGLITLDAGALALSKDLGSGQGDACVYGILVDAASGAPLDLAVSHVNQEHGIVQATPADFERLPIGSQVRILPNHACMTAAAYDQYSVVSGDRLAGFWDRCQGW